jgi:carboxypeptidase-like protein/TonB-dependent receptor-like protein
MHNTLLCENLLHKKQRYLSGMLPVVIFTAIFLLTLSQRVTAQNNSPTISLKAKNEPLVKIFAAIESQTGYVFFYDGELLRRCKPVTCSVTNEKLDIILEKALKDQGLTYSIENKTINISPKKIAPPAVAPPAASTPIIPTPEDSLIRGLIMDRNRNAMVGVTVTNTGKSHRMATVTNAAGAFEIRGQKGDKLIFTIVGYKKQERRYNGENTINISMEVDVVALNEIEVTNTDFTRKKIPFTDTIDMTHRSHLNLGQLLQGTVPGLTLQYSNQTQQTLTSISNPTGNGVLLPNYTSTMSLQDLQTYYNQNASYFASAGVSTFNDYLKFMKGMVGFQFNYTTTINNNGLVPELRGVSGFNGNTSGMLVVIDGFPQDGFPADYPMTNIESVKVIKDPEELTKWGPKAAGGAIIITSKRAEAGKLQLSYNANFYYSPAPRFNRNKQLLAPSADILSYMKDASDSGFLVLGTNPSAGPGFNYNSAESLLHGLQEGSLPQDIFNGKWDSLGKLSNESQLKLFQQNIFNQNHTLRLSGGSRDWRFTAAGSYNTNRASSLNNFNHTTGLTLNNDFLLLKNKLRANLYSNTNFSKGNAGYSLDPGSLEPYQLFLDPHSGKYIYDYSTFNPDANAIIEGYGYENYGVNLLQDARINSNITRTLSSQSRLTVDWDLFPGLKWSGFFQYDLTNTNNENIQDAASSQAREMVDNYGSPLLDNNGNVTGINFHVPSGGILKKSHTRASDWNLRSAFQFNKVLGKHHLSLTIGGGAFGNVMHMPSYATIYGYNRQTGKGQPVLLPSSDPTAGVGNFYGLPGSFWANNNQVVVYPNTLLTPNAGDTTISRGLDWNGSLSYSYKNTYMLTAKYNAVLNPNYGNTPAYTTLANYSAQAGWRLSSEPFFHAPAWISNIVLSTGLDGIDIPALPVQIAATRNLQAEWNNYGVWVANYNPAQQTGQNTHNIYEKLTLGMAAGKFVVDMSYNTLSIAHTAIGTGGTAGTGNGGATEHYVGANGQLKLRNGLLFLSAGYARSPEGNDQTNIRAGYDIARETYFHSRVISKLSADFILQNISSYQGMELMTGTNAPLTGGGFSMAVNNNFGLLPPQIRNLEAHAIVSIFKDRYLLDLRFYHKTTSGLNNNIPLPTDPSTGLVAQVSYSEIVNKGVELYLRIKVIERKNFSYTITPNGAYNDNIAQKVPAVNFSQTSAYLSAYRNGYSTSNLWSYRWAGLDATGSPQIYASKGQKTAKPDSATLSSAPVYSGVTRAPYTGGLLQEWNYKDFFIRATILLNLGHVMREYIPAASSIVDNSILIRDRWRKPGDEAHTDIAAMSGNATAGSVRQLIIQNSSNSILPADNIRLQEVQIGWQAPAKMLRGFIIKALTLSLQVENAAVWERNKLHVDPQIVSSAGQIGLPIPRQYSFSINMSL